MGLCQVQLPPETRLPLLLLPQHRTAKPEVRAQMLPFFFSSKHVKRREIKHPFIVCIFLLFLKNLGKETIMENQDICSFSDPVVRALSVGGAAVGRGRW